MLHRVLLCLLYHATHYYPHGPDASCQVELKLKESSQRLMAFERDFVHSKKDHDRRRRDQIRGQRSQLDGRLLEVTWDAHAARLTNFILTEARLRPSKPHPQPVTLALAPAPPPSRRPPP